MASGDFDNTNRGAAFPPFPDQRMILQGQLNIDGNDQRIVVVHQPVKRDGEKVIVVYEKKAVLWPTNKTTKDGEYRESLPEYSGVVENRPDLRIAGWKHQKDGRAYISFQISPKDPNGGQRASEEQGDSRQSADDWDDEIPF